MMRAGDGWRSPRYVGMAVLLAAVIPLGGCDALWASLQEADQPPTRKASLTEPGAPPELVRLNVVISAGRVAPSNLRITVHSDQSILLTITSDAADTLLVDSDPPQSFQVSAAEGQGYGFHTGGAGVFTVKLHNLQQTIATIDASAG
jgi:hypothetical protein